MNVKSGWVKVSKELPKELQMVDIFTKSKVRIIDALYTYVHDTQHEFWYKENGCTIRLGLDVVTHWMPTPEVPKDDEIEPEYVNTYKCPSCMVTWKETWSCGCASECPDCGRKHVSPLDSVLKPDTQTDQCFSNILIPFAKVCTWCLTLEDFALCLADGCFIDDDGHGYYALADKMSNKKVELDVSNLDRDFTHVVWFTK